MRNFVFCNISLERCSKLLMLMCMIRYCVSLLYVFLVAIYSYGQTCQDKEVTVSEEWIPQLQVKTNAVGLAMAVANLAVEVDFAKHWSFTLPVYYSAWDYFKPTLKFRTFTVQPEVRYWFNRDNEKWFLGAHFGYGYYNFALDGDYRTQDYNRETPSMGGGLSVGYRTHFSKNKRWKMEFTLGGGVYDSHYDKFRNEENGFLVRTEKKTWFGIDQVAVSFVYSFNLKKGGNR